MILPVNDVYNIDCLKGLEQVKPESVDLLLTDPPFGINFHKVGTQYNRSQKELGKMYSEVSEEDYYDFTLNWVKLAWKSMKPTASGFIFSGWNNLGDILNALTEVGGRLVNHIIWKYQFGVFTKKKFVSSHYHILYFTKMNEKKDHLRTFNRIKEYTNSKLQFCDSAIGAVISAGICAGVKMGTLYAFFIGGLTWLSTVCPTGAAYMSMAFDSVDALVSFVTMTVSWWLDVPIHLVNPSYNSIMMIGPLVFGMYSSTFDLTGTLPRWITVNEMNKLYPNQGDFRHVIFENYELAMMNGQYYDFFGKYSSDLECGPAWFT